MNPKGIASAGNLIIDYVKTIDTFPNQGNLSNILAIDRSIGGAPVNCLINLAKMDSRIPLQAIGVIGNDKEGEEIVEILNSYNIDTSLVYKNLEQRTSFTDVINDCSKGERTFFHYRGANSLLGLQHFDFSKINAKILHIGYALLLDMMDSNDEEYGTVMAKTLAEAQRHNIKTSIDVVSENSERFSKIIPPSLKYTNYCIINEVEASLITGIPARVEGAIDIESIKCMSERLFTMGVNDIVVIHSAEAGFCMDKNKNFCYRTAFLLPQEYIKGKVGAGDAFCAGMLYSIYKGWDIDYGLEVANAAAACCLSEVNAIDGMKNIYVICDMALGMYNKKLSC